MNRRQFLQAASVAGVGASLSGCNRGGDDTPTHRRTAHTEETSTSQEPTPSPTAGSPTPTPTPEPRFENVVDAVSDLGCDPDAGEPCDDAVQGAIADGTLIEFPPGEYLVTKPLNADAEIKFGIRGTGEHRRDVRFIHPEGFGDRLLYVRTGKNCLFENFTADQTSDRATNSGLVIHQDDGLVLRNVEVAGFTPTGGGGTKDLIVQITDPSGRGIVERYVTKGGGQVGVYPRGHVGLYSGRLHRGTLHLVNCHIEQCGSNGVYASRTYGPVKVDAGLYKNNAVSQIRVCGEGSHVRNARVVVDIDAADRVQGSYNAVRGIWWESGWQGKSGGRVENCEFVARSAEVLRGLLEVDGTAGSLTVEGCQFQIEHDGFRALLAAPPGSSDMGNSPDKPWDLAVLDTEITVEASNGVDVHVDGRPGSHIEGLETTHEGGRARDGIFLSNCYGSEITDCSSRSSRYPLWVFANRSRDSADPLLCLGPDVSIASTGPETVDLEPVFGTADSGDEGDVCVRNPTKTPFSVVSIQKEAGTYFGQELDSSPEYLDFTQS